MIDFDTAVQTALSPIVTIPVIAALTLVLDGTIYDSHRRLRNAAADNAKKTLKMKEALRPGEGPNGEKYPTLRPTDTFDPNRVGGGSGIARGAAPSVDDFIADMKRPEDAAGLEGNGGSPRPYHTAAMSGEPSFSNPSPRAG